jgi:hypothetical protein
MAVTISLYDHTVSRFANGSNIAGDTYNINLYSTLSFIQAATTKVAAESGATQLTSANGYTQDTKTLANVAISVVTTNDAKFDADDVSWTASGGNIGPCQYALLYNGTDADDPPVAFIDFGEAKTANDGTPFNITWNASGIISFTYT